ncbi:MAG: serine/threonine-protein kinase [Myxococcota bacterium]|jgi:hypothetical protein|nr:serine/threonine-protein kinase [Myxococcota bacterium]
MFCPACQAELPKASKTCPSCEAATRIAQRWRLQKILGEGSFGHTWLAVDAQGKQVAVKELSVGRARSVKTLELFEREVAVLRKLDHQGVPKFIDHVVVEGAGAVRFYLVQEYIDGQTLELGSGDERDVIKTLAELCDILSYLHARRPPVIHRDIKASNLMRRKDGRLVLIDFGAVQQAVRDAAQGGSTVAGTFGYMAPEQLRGIASPASDLYAVGALGVALLSGRDPAELVDPIRPQHWQEKVSMSEPLRELLAALLEPDPEQRLQSAQDAGAWARSLLEASPVEVKRSKIRRSPGSTPSPVAKLEQPQLLRLLRKHARQLRSMDRWYFAEAFALFYTPVMLLPFLFWGGYGVFSLLESQGWAQPSFGDGVLAVVLAYAVWLVVALSLRARAQARHPWLAGVVRQSLLSLWHEKPKLDPDWRAYVASRDKDPYFSDSEIPDALEKHGQALFLLPLLEARAYRLYLAKRYTEAAALLDKALELVRLRAPPGSFYVPLFARRYAVLAFASTGHREGAMAQFQEAEAALEAEAARRQLAPDALEIEGYREFRKQHGARSSEKHEEAREQLLRRFRRQLRRKNLPVSWAPGPWLGWILVTGFIGAMAGMLSAGVLTALGVFGPEPQNTPPFLPFMLSGASLPTLVAVLAQLFWPVRTIPSDWRQLYPEFERQWPKDHALRAHLIEALERIWSSFGRHAKVACEAVVQLERQSSLQRSTGSLDWSNLREVMGFVSGRRRKEKDSDAFTEEQRVQLAELHSLRSWYNEAIVENIQTLVELPVDHVERRIALLEHQAGLALKAKLEDVALSALREVEALRNSD